MPSPFKFGRPLRVLACIEARSVTGPAKNLLMLAQALSADPERPCEIRIVTFTRGETRNAFIEACAKAGVGVEIVRERRRFDPGVLTQLRGVASRFRPDIIQSHNVKSHFLIRFSGLDRAIPWIAFNHGYTAEDLKMKLYNQLDRWTLPRAGRLVVVCGAFGDSMRKWGIAGERIAVRHNSVEQPPQVSQAEADELRARLQIAPRAHVLLSIGRLSKEKAHIDLLRAAAALKRRGEPAFRLVIVGAGPELQRLQGAAEGLGIAGETIFAGVTSRVAPYFAIADVFVLPSHSEGSPNVLLEAMAGGVPVIATAVGGVPEIVQSGSTGLLVPARDPERMADAISRLLADPNLRATLAGRARQYVASSHSREQHVRWISDLYLSVLGEERAEAILAASPSAAGSSRL